MHFQQCVVQQIKLELRCPPPEDKKKKGSVSGEAAATLLQLPGVDAAAVGALGKGEHIKTLEVRHLACRYRWEAAHVTASVSTALP